MFICYLYIFFGEVAVKIFGPFFNCAVCSLIVKKSLCILGNGPLSDVSFGHSPCFPFALLAVPSHSPLLIPDHLYLFTLAGGWGQGSVLCPPLFSLCSHTLTPLLTSPSIMVLKPRTPDSHIQDCFCSVSSRTCNGHSSSHIQNRTPDLSPQTHFFLSLSHQKQLCL